MKYLYFSVCFFALVLLIGVINLAKLNRAVSDIQSMPPSQDIGQTSAKTDYQLVLKKISQLEQEITSLKIQLQTKAPVVIDKNLPTPFMSSSLQMLEIADPKWQAIDVFEKPLASSKVIGQANYGIIYFYESTQTGWYQIHLDLDNLGWVQSQFVKELP